MHNNYSDIFKTLNSLTASIADLPDLKISIPDQLIEQTQYLTALSQQISELSKSLNIPNVSPSIIQTFEIQGRIIAGIEKNFSHIYDSLDNIPSLTQTLQDSAKLSAKLITNLSEGENQRYDENFASNLEPVKETLSETSFSKKTLTLEQFQFIFNLITFIFSIWLTIHLSSINSEEFQQLTEQNEEIIQNQEFLIENASYEEEVLTQILKYIESIDEHLKQIPE